MTLDQLEQRILDRVNDTALGVFIIDAVEQYRRSQHDGKPIVSGLPSCEDELWIEANALYSKKEHSQDGRDLQVKHFTIARRQ